MRSNQLAKYTNVPNTKRAIPLCCRFVDSCNGMKNGMANTKMRREFSATANGCGMSRQNSEEEIAEGRCSVRAMFQANIGKSSKPQLRR